MSHRHHERAPESRPTERRSAHRFTCHVVRGPNDLDDVDSTQSSSSHASQSGSRRSPASSVSSTHEAEADAVADAARKAYRNHNTRDHAVLLVAGPAHTVDVHCAAIDQGHRSLLDAQLTAHSINRRELMTLSLRCSGFQITNLSNIPSLLVPKADFVTFIRHSEHFKNYAAPYNPESLIAPVPDDSDTFATLSSSVHEPSINATKRAVLAVQRDQPSWGYLLCFCVCVANIRDVVENETRGSLRAAALAYHTVMREHHPYGVEVSDWWHLATKHRERKVMKACEDEGFLVSRSTAEAMVTEAVLKAEKQSAALRTRDMERAKSEYEYRLEQRIKLEASKTKKLLDANSTAWEARMAENNRVWEAKMAENNRAWERNLKVALSRNKEEWEAKMAQNNRAWEERMEARIDQAVNAALARVQHAHARG